MVNVEDLLAECAALLNRYGPDSPRVAAFIAEHKANTEFAELADLSVKLKREFLSAPKPNGVGNGQLAR